MRHSMLIGERTAEDLKISIGSATADSNSKKDKFAVVRGRDIETGLPKSIKVSDNDVREALSPVVSEITETAASLIEEIPPELISDILEKGITICGGGSMLSGIDKILAERVKMPVSVADDPMTAVVRGCAKVLENDKLLNLVRVTGGVR
jgi:rod shape-determining protein MreB and related proteins